MDPNTTRLWPDDDATHPEDAPPQSWNARPRSSSNPGTSQTTRLWPESGPPREADASGSQPRGDSQTQAGRPTRTRNPGEIGPGDTLFALSSGLVAFILVGLIWGWPTFDHASPDYLATWCMRHAIKFIAVECLLIVPYVVLTNQNT